MDTRTKHIMALRSDCDLGSRLLSGEDVSWLRVFGRRLDLQDVESTSHQNFKRGRSENTGTRGGVVRYQCSQRDIDQQHS